MLFMMRGTLYLSALPGVRDQYPALFSPAKNTMLLFKWQRGIVGVAHCIIDCCEVLCEVLGTIVS